MAESSSVSLPPISVTYGTDKAKASSWEVNLNVSCRWEAPDHLNHHILLPKMYISRKLDWEVELRLKLSHYVMDTDIANMSEALGQTPVIFWLCLCEDWE